MILNSKKISLKLKTLRNHGQKPNKPYYYNMTGGNFRLSNILASIGYSQLLRIKKYKKKNTNRILFMKKIYRKIKFFSYARSNNFCLYDGDFQYFSIKKKIETIL